MKPVLLTIPAYDRTELFAECLNRLSKNDQRLFDVLIAPDRASDENASEIERIIRESKLQIATMAIPDERLGADKNTIRVVNFAAEMGYDYVGCIGADIIVSSNFIHDLFELSSWFDAHAAIPTTGRHSIEEKLAHVNSIQYGSNTGQDFILPTYQWKRIKPIVTAISDRYYFPTYNLKRHYEQRVVMQSLIEAARYNVTEYSKSILEPVEFNSIGTSEDGLIGVALAMCGIPMVSYVINRAAHPSDTGVNTTREHWEQYYAGVEVDELPKADPS
jgi:hypothetical protein